MEDHFKELRVPPAYDVEQIRKNEFARIKDQIYLDHAAATLYSHSQIQSWAEELQSGLFGNPHSRHSSSDTVTQIVDGVRHRILEHFNTDATEYDVIFTSGATSGLQLVAQCFPWNTINGDVTNDNGNTNENHIKAIKVKGSFIYMKENHTSVLGIRGIADERGADVYVENAEDVQKLFDNFSGSISNEINNDQTRNLQHCLFAYSAQCNFSGHKYPLNWIDKTHKGALSEVLQKSAINKSENLHSNEKLHNSRWYVLLDAAGLAATCPIDLTRYQPDFVPISFYKIFGFPTGLGCLLVHKRAWNVLQKSYFGGGTVLMNETVGMQTIPRPVLHERFEDGTISFLDVMALRHSFDNLTSLTGSMENIMNHVFQLANYTHHCLSSLHHNNGAPVVKLYTENNKTLSVENQGSIVNFNLLNANGSCVGYSQVERVASIYNIHLRTGCLCNPGACQSFLGITPQMLKQQFEAGHVCGDSHDLVNGKPTGSVRVSFGYMSTYEDADHLIKMIIDCFVEHPLVIKKEEIKSDQLAIIDKMEEFSQYNDASYSEENAQAAINSSGDKISFENPQTINLNGISDGREALTITDIFLYPVKSCGPMKVKRWCIGSKGLSYDRSWMIVTSSGVTLTQKRLPLMSQIIPSLDLEKSSLTLSFEGYESITISFDSMTEPGISASMCGGRVCGDRVKGNDCGEKVSQWLSQVLQKEALYLMYQVNERKGKLSVKNKEFDENESISLANESQYLVIHRPSVRKLLHDIQEGNHSSDSEITEEDLVSRFRANIVLDGGKPYEEDHWTYLATDNLHFNIQGLCRRCQMVCVEPSTSHKSREPMLTLAATRGAAMNFGVHAANTQKNIGETFITVGSNVTAIGR